jgi:hypothetical protein
VGKSILAAAATAAVCFSITATTGFASRQSPTVDPYKSLARRVTRLETAGRIQVRFNALTLTRLADLENRRLTISDGVGGSTVIAPGTWGYINGSTCPGLNSVAVAYSFQTDYPIWVGSVQHSFSGWRLAAFVNGLGHSAVVSAHPICLSLE